MGFLGKNRASVALYICLHVEKISSWRAHCPPPSPDLSIKIRYLGRKLGCLRLHKR
jgi:hypothetical protein